MIARSLFSCIMALLLPGLAPSAVRITVTNPSTGPRVNETAVVSWTSLRAASPGIAPSGLRLAGDDGTELPVQVDDLDADGSPDEMAFPVDLKAGETKTFLLTSDPDTGSRAGKFRTDAGNWKWVEGRPSPVDDDDCAGAARDRKSYRFDGVGWESELIAYRLYLDGRNAVDIQGKRKPGLYWNWIGGSNVDYQLDADWGMDVLHVGPALGVGGIGLWAGDSLVKPLALDRQRCRILARGPVRAVVRVDYSGWRVGDGTADVTSLFTIAAGERISEHRVTLTGGADSLTLATGIVMHDSTKTQYRTGWLRSVGHQSRANDTLQMAIAYDRTLMVGTAHDSSNHLVLLRLQPGLPVRLMISALWQGETGGAWDDAAARAIVETSALRLSEPLVVSVHPND